MEENHQYRKKKGQYFNSFLRNQSKFYVNAFSIVDRKAAIMIRINSMIIPVLFFLSNDMDAIVFGKAIALILISTSIISLVFAVNGSRSNFFRYRMLSKQKGNARTAALKEDIFIIGWHDISLDAYKKIYQKVADNTELQILNHAHVTYKMDEYLRKAFTQLELAYLAFMIGFVLSSIVFLAGVMTKWLG